MRTCKNKMKKPKIKTLKAKLDRVFSEFIRLRDSWESSGMRVFKCVSCNQVKHYDQADCGHYYGRANMALRFDEKNCNAQCKYCNRFNEGNRQGYALGLQQKYGKDILNQLQVKSIQINKIAVFEYEALIKHYQEQLKHLK